MNIIEIIEARSHPEQNPRQYTIQVLKQRYEQVKRSGDYIDQNTPNLFINFIGLEKLGINPSVRKPDTPMGIYAYPVKIIIEDGVNPQELYAGDSDYVNVFQISGNILNLGTITDQERTNYLNQIRDILLKTGKFNNRQSQLELNTLQHFNTDTASWWKIINILIPAYFSKIWQGNHKTLITKLFRKFFNINGIYDPGLSIIAGDIPTEIVIFNIGIIKNNQRIFNLVESNVNLTDDMLIEFIQKISANSQRYFEHLKMRQIMNKPMIRLIDFVYNWMKTSDLETIKSTLGNIKSTTMLKIKLKDFIYLKARQFNVPTIFIRMVTQIVIPKIDALEQELLAKQQNNVS